MISSDRPLLVIGGGNMAQAMVTGWLQSGFVSPDALVMVDRHPEKMAGLRETFAFTQHTDIAHAASLSPAVVLLAVKPYAVADLLAIVASQFPDALVASVAAGLAISHYETAMPPGTAICRIMPNTPCAVGEGMSVICYNAHCDDSHKQWAQNACEAFGKTSVISEEHMHIATAVSGSGPAYMFYLMEQMTAVAQKHGLDATAARLLVTQTLCGAAKMAQQSPLELSTLRENVTSPGGTTQAGLSQLMSDPFDRIIEQTVEAAMSRSETLSE